MPTDPPRVPLAELARSSSSPRTSLRKARLPGKANRRAPRASIWGPGSPVNAGTVARLTSKRQVTCGSGPGRGLDQEGPDHERSRAGRSLDQIEDGSSAWRPPRLVLVTMRLALSSTPAGQAHTRLDDHAGGFAASKGRYDRRDRSGDEHGVRSQAGEDRHWLQAGVSGLRETRADPSGRRWQPSDDGLDSVPAAGPDGGCAAGIDRSVLRYPSADATARLRASTTSWSCSEAEVTVRWFRLGSRFDGPVRQGRIFTGTCGQSRPGRDGPSIAGAGLHGRRPR